MSTVNFPIMYIPDPEKGRPIFKGKIFIGVPDLDPEIPANQKDVYYVLENGNLVAAIQPIETSSGGVPVYNGSPVALDIDGNYSLKINNNLDAQVYYIPNSVPGSPGGSSTIIVEETIVLTAGQTTIAFSGLNASKASVYIGSKTVDRGRLINNVDYTVTGTSTIELSESYPAGSLCLGVSDTDVTGVDITPKDAVSADPFVRSLVHNLPFIDDAYEYLQATYGFTQLYPQAIAIDEDADEIIMSRGGAGGVNNWAWYWVYELSTGNFKTCFTSGEHNWESLVIRYDGSTRYLYAINQSDQVYRMNITVLPSLYATVVPDAYYNVNPTTQMTYDGQFFYVSQTGDGVYKGTGHRHVYVVFDEDFNKVGDLVFPMAATGTFGDDISKFVKSQDITFHKGGFLISCGTIYKKGNATDNPALFQGFTATNIIGDLIGQYVSRPDEAIVKMEELVGHECTLLENEGIYSTGENVYCCWPTLDKPEWTNPAFAGVGIAITLEYSTKQDSVDFSSSSTGLPTPYNKTVFENTVHSDTAQLLDPIQRGTLDSFVKIMDMMRDADMSTYTFDGTNQSVFDGVGTDVPTEGNLLEVVALDGIQFMFRVSGEVVSREYWIKSNDIANQVIKNITFT